MLANIVLSGFKPATVARRTNGYTLAKAYLSHLLAVSMIAVAIFILIALESAAWPLSPDGFVEALIDAVGEVVREYEKGSSWLWFGTLLTVAGIELAFVALALLLTPWGALDEPLSMSFRSGLRRVWIHTGHGFTVVILAGLLLVSNALLPQEGWVPYPGGYYPKQPTGTNGQPPTAQELEEFRIAVDKCNADAQQFFQHRHEQWVRSSAWFVVYADAIAANGCSICAIWLIWGLLRAVGASREHTPIIRPPRCEFCGYNLTSMAMDSRCPECGQPVEASLGSGVRPGALWEQRNVVGRVAAWWRCVIDATIRPTAFGRRLQATSTRTDHRRFMVFHLPLIFLVGASSVLALLLIQMSGPFAPPVEVFLIGVPVFGWLCVAGTIGVTLLCALLLGWVHGLTEKRNLVPVSMQAACYLAPFLVLWAILGAVTGLSVMLVENAGGFQWVEDTTGIYRSAATAISWLIPNAACGIAYLILISRITAAARFANR